METTNDFLSEFDKVIQYFIGHNDNEPNTEFCRNVDKLINIKADLANGVSTGDGQLTQPAVSVSLPEILRALDTTECELLPSEWIKNEPNNVNYMGGFLTGVRWRERQ